MDESELKALDEFLKDEGFDMESNHNLEGEKLGWGIKVMEHLKLRI